MRESGSVDSDRRGADVRRGHPGFRGGDLKSRFCKPSEMPVSNTPAVVGVVMGSSSDWETLQQATAILAEFGVP